jgi:hypothetical protein
MPFRRRSNSLEEMLTLLRSTLLLNFYLTNTALYYRN